MGITAVIWTPGRRSRSPAKSGKIGKQRGKTEKCIPMMRFFAMGALSRWEASPGRPRRGSKSSVSVPSRSTGSLGIPVALAMLSELSFCFLFAKDKCSAAGSSNPMVYWEVLRRRAAESLATWLVL